MTTSNWISVAGLFLVVVMALSGLIARLFTRVSRVEFRMDLLWTPVEKAMSKLLHSPHPEHSERDMLLEKLQDGALSNGDVERLTLLLLPIANGTEESSDGKRVAAALFIGRLAERKVYQESVIPNIPRMFKRILGR